jgi:isochorismate hydrolase
MSVPCKKNVIIASVSALVGVAVGAVGAFLVDEKWFTHKSLLADIKRSEQQLGDELVEELGEQP